MENKFNMSESRRRSCCGMKVAFWKDDALGKLDSSFPHQDGGFGNEQLMGMLRRSKMYLSMREPDEELVFRLERRREWNSCRFIKNNLDLFPSVKFSYSSINPCFFKNKNFINLVATEGGGARFFGIARSFNMRLDPVDAQKVSYRRRLEIQRALTWGYCNGFVPILMTLTIFHDWTWKPLIDLISVLRKSYDDLFAHKVGGKLKEKIGFKYRIFRMEETIDMKRAGWHPHYHVVLFVPKGNLDVLTFLEPKLKTRWSRLVQKHYRAVFSEDIPESYLPALYEHGLFFSRYSDGVFKGQLYQVDNSKYLAKIMGCDSSEIYGGDKELSSVFQKDSFSPFDLLRGKITAEAVDLWNEYAIATKGLSCFRFSPGFKKVIDEYFEQHPERDPVDKRLPKESLVAQLRADVYHLLYRHFKLDELKAKTAEGYESLLAWLNAFLEEFGDELPEQSAKSKFPFVLPADISPEDFPDLPFEAKYFHFSPSLNAVDIHFRGRADSTFFRIKLDFYRLIYMHNKLDEFKSEIEKSWEESRYSTGCRGSLLRWIYEFFEDYCHDLPEPIDDPFAPTDEELAEGLVVDSHKDSFEYEDLDKYKDSESDWLSASSLPDDFEQHPERYPDIISPWLLEILRDRGIYRPVFDEGDESG